MLPQKENKPTTTLSGDTKQQCKTRFHPAPHPHPRFSTAPNPKSQDRQSHRQDRCSMKISQMTHSPIKRMRPSGSPSVQAHALSHTVQLHSPSSRLSIWHNSQVTTQQTHGFPAEQRSAAHFHLRPAPVGSDAIPSLFLNNKQNNSSSDSGSLESRVPVQSSPVKISAVQSIHSNPSS